ncbi:MAG: amidase family protein, partial [Cyanobacteria bacterium J06633_2]
MKPLVFVAAHELARKIREREISSLEVVEAHLQQIQDYNPKLNAICLLDEAGARARAQAADEAIAQGQLWGPLHGVPITIKELFEIKGVRTTAGFKALANYIPRQDAPTVTQLRQAGAVILG